jgi:hypothetical protein
MGASLGRDHLAWAPGGFMFRLGKVRHLRGLGALVVGIGLMLGQVVPVMAQTDYSRLSDSHCLLWADTRLARAEMTTSGTYIQDYYWFRPTISMWTNACGADAPYGEYRLSSTKQITAKFWINKKDLESCTGEVPLAFKCTATASSTTATYTGASGSASTTTKTVGWSEVRFIDAPTGGHAYMQINGKTTMLGDEYNNVISGTMQ